MGARVAHKGEEAYLSRFRIADRTAENHGRKERSLWFVGSELASAVLMSSPQTWKGSMMLLLQALSVIGASG